jgi:hypothetical protein
VLYRVCASGCIAQLAPSCRLQLSTPLLIPVVVRAALARRCVEMHTAALWLLAALTKSCHGNCIALASSAPLMELLVRRRWCPCVITVVGLLTGVRIGLHAWLCRRSWRPRA